MEVDASGKVLSNPAAQRVFESLDMNETEGERLPAR
jgi:hypothetical protein